MMAKKRKNGRKIATQKSQKSNVRSFFRLIWAVIRNKEDTKGQFTKITFVLLMSYLLNIAAFSLGFLGLFGLGLIGCKAFRWNWTSVSLWPQYIITIVIALPICALILLFAIVLRGFANEIEREEDKNYIVAIFSGVVSFAALVVALVALFRE